MTNRAGTLVLFAYDWDALAFRTLRGAWPQGHAGFDLFSFPDNARLAWFDLEHFVDRLTARARACGWQAVVSHHEQFGVLAAALLAERMGWPGTPVEAVLACQHKLHARRLLSRAHPAANPRFAALEARYGDQVPEGLEYPLFVKPVKAAFSVLARQVGSRAELHRHTRFGPWELWVIRHLVEPFERIAGKRLPGAGTAHGMLVEAPLAGHQYNLDGYVFDGRVVPLGCVDAVMYPGTHCFMRFEVPSRLAAAVLERALAVARDFLGAAGFTHGLFNMEFFHDPATGRLTVIEFNPRLASQFSDLHARVAGIDAHAMSLMLAHGRDPADVPRRAPTCGAAASFVYRAFPGEPVPGMPSREARADMARRFPDALLLAFPKDRAQIARDFKWLRSYRYGILHLGGRDVADLRRRCEEASAILGWPAPYADGHCAPCRIPPACPCRPDQPLQGDPPMTRTSRLLAIVGLAFLLGACGAMRAQNPGSALSPVNAVAEGDDASVMLKGADVVAYFTQNRYVQGQPAIKSVWQGVTFRFATAENKALFDRDPAKYQPEFGGYCANGLAYGIPWGGDADRFKMVDGRLYIFGGQGSLDAWNLDEPRNLALSRKYWDEEVKGSNSFWQRTKRLIFRVPHYKSGEELARDVEAARGKG